MAHQCTGSDKSETFAVCNDNNNNQNNNDDDDDIAQARSSTTTKNALKTTLEEVERRTCKVISGSQVG